MGANPPIRWYEITESTSCQLPFANFYALDPSENPTVRPARASLELIPIPGERGLFIVGVQRNPHLSERPSTPG